MFPRSNPKALLTSLGVLALTAQGIAAQGIDPSADPDTTIEKILRADLTNRFGSLFGYVVKGPGSWNGDSYDDLAVGAPGANAGSGIRGRAEILFGFSPISDSMVRRARSSSKPKLTAPDRICGRSVTEKTDEKPTPL